MGIKEKIKFRIYGGNTKPGHYYSPVPSLSYINENKKQIFNDEMDIIPGIDLRTENQLELLVNLSEFLKNYPFPVNEDDFRYYSANPYYNQSDSMMAYAVLRYFKPQRIIEAGSGFSSFLMLDTNEHFLDNQIQFTFIDPYPERLLSRLSEKDKKKHTIHPKNLQDIDISTFDSLEKNDILFIDSSHVSKIGSDVNYVIFSILPRLKPGVIIHVHDICFPFEYPEEWVLNGTYWNEAYLLRAFLQYNSSFEILLFNNYLYKKQKEWFAQNEIEFGAGGSIWLKKK